MFTILGTRYLHSIKNEWKSCVLDKSKLRTYIKFKDTPKGENCV